MSTLYVMEQGAVVQRDGGQIVVRRESRVLERIPSSAVERVVLFGNAHLSTPAVAFLLERGIDTVFLGQGGRYRGRLQPATGHDPSTRLHQYSARQDPERRLDLARAFVMGKIANMTALCRRQRRSPDGATAVQALERLERKATEAEDLDVLRGFEGAASAAYFRAYRAFVRPEFGFSGRNQRPPRDPANALLSFGYTLLHSELIAQTECVGLDPYLGFLHDPKSGHAALASDLMEEWRPVLVDSLVLFLTSRREFSAGDFEPREGGVWMTRVGVSKFVARYDARMARRVSHPGLSLRLSYRQCIAAQVRQLARSLSAQGSYEPFRSR